MTDEDDDGNSASHGYEQKAPIRSAIEASERKSPYPSSPNDLGSIIQRIKESEDENEVVALYDKAKTNRLSEKQLAWLDREKKTALNRLREIPDLPF